MTTACDLVELGRRARSVGITSLRFDLDLELGSWCAYACQGNTIVVKVGPEGSSEEMLNRLSARLMGTDDAL